MGVRKRQSAELIKEAKKTQAFAKLLDVPSSPRKMRLLGSQERAQGRDWRALRKHYLRRPGSDAQASPSGSARTWLQNPQAC